MECLNCQGTDVITFFNEIITCSHCKEDNNVSYNVCQTCGLIWKAVDDQPISESVFTELELGEMLGGSLDKFMENISHETASTGTMNEIVHKCLRCETISYEVAPCFYRCPECRFEWEVST